MVIYVVKILQMERDFSQAELNIQVAHKNIGNTTSFLVPPSQSKPDS